MKYSRKHSILIKNEKQKIALKASKDHPFLFLEWFTGLGKTLAALRILGAYEGNWVIVVKELNHMITWKDEAKNWKISLDKVQIITYNSLHKLDKRKSYNLILDEAHALTALRRDKLKKLKINRIVALTATMPYDKKTLIGTLGKFTYYSINMAKAIDEGIVPEPTIYQVFVTLNAKDLVKYTNLTYGIAKAMDEENEYLANILGGKRKQILANAKTAAIKKYLQKSRRFVCFTGSIKQCDILGGKNVIHSKQKDREEIIRKFNDLEISNLFAVNMLRESMNLKNIEIGYIGQLDNQEKSFIQMLGRSFRSKTPIMYVFTCKNTVDERFASTAFKSIPSKYIRTLEY